MKIKKNQFISILLNICGKIELVVELNKFDFFLRNT